MEFLGYNKDKNGKIKYVTILSRSFPRKFEPVPDDFRVIALIATYNEIDVIEPVIKHLSQNAIDVYVIDNWSTDGTFEKTQRMINQGVIGFERWPPSGPSDTYNLMGILKRKEDLCNELDADWFIHSDADEIRESPWSEINLRDSIYYVDAQGFNAIDFTVLEFHPVDNTYRSGSNFDDHFKYFSFSDHPAHFMQVKAWKKSGPVDLLSWAGHNAEFVTKKVFPYKFLLKHYPIRSQEHGEKKVLKERRPRWNTPEIQLGWHNHYDFITSTTSFLKNRKGMIPFDADFYSDYLIERLSGIGIIKNDNVEKPTLTSQLGERDKAVQNLTVQLTEKEQSVRALKAHLAQKDIQLDQIINSKSWKIVLFFHGIISPFKIIGRDRTTKEDVALIKSSGLFDETWYLAKYPDVAQAKVDPALHFLRHGGLEERDPGPLFNSRWYLENNPDVKDARENPLVHYLRYGNKEGRRKSPQTV